MPAYVKHWEWALCFGALFKLALPCLYKPSTGLFNLMKTDLILVYIAQGKKQYTNRFQLISYT